MNKQRLKLLLKNYVATNRQRFFHKKSVVNYMTGKPEYKMIPTAGLYLVVKETLDYKYSVVDSSYNIAFAMNIAKRFDDKEESAQYYVVFVRALAHNNFNVYARVDFPKESKTFL